MPHIDRRPVPISGRGNTLSSRVSDAATGKTIASTTAKDDSYGRIVRSTDDLTGRFSVIDYGTAASRWLGPATLKGEDGLLTCFTQYTALGQVKERKYQGVTTTCGYDVAGNLVDTWESAGSGADQLLSHSQIDYDALGRPIRSLDPQGTTTCWAYAVDILAQAGDEDHGGGPRRLQYRAFGIGLVGHHPCGLAGGHGQVPPATGSPPPPAGAWSGRST